MTDSSNIPEDTDEAFRPIPDGDLGSSMPAWLKERPSWSQETVSETALLPDNSPIDPRELVRDEDLPQWLRAISLRDAGQAILPDLESDPEWNADSSVDANSPISPAKSTSPKPEWMTHSAPEPAIPAESTVDMQRWLTSGEVPPEKRKLISDPVLAGLIAAGLIVVAVALYLLYA